MSRFAAFAAAGIVSIAAAASGGCGAGTDGSPGEDPPVGPGQVVVAAAGDFGLEPPAVATLDAIGVADPDLVLGLGDLSYAGPGSEDQFCDLVGSTVGMETPFELISGNHEEDTGGDGRIKSFARCLP
ncbi:MAG: phosphohydrolase, partial [Actinomycetota bacterium]|nr:phosphohydrolase [Actinomycetota bacterium]